jgi:hypothetical protein
MTHGLDQWLWAPLLFHTLTSHFLNLCPVIRRCSMSPRSMMLTLEVLGAVACHLRPGLSPSSEATQMNTWLLYRMLYSLVLASSAAVSDRLTTL